MTAVKKMANQTPKMAAGEEGCRDSKSSVAPVASVEKNIALLELPTAMLPMFIFMLADGCAAAASGDLAEGRSSLCRKITHSRSTPPAEIRYG